MIGALCGMPIIFCGACFSDLLLDFIDFLGIHSFPKLENCTEKS